MRIREAKGFTLVEVMIVVAIIALLAAIAVPNLMKARQAANDAASVATLRAHSTALETYAAAEESYPLSLDVMITEDYIQDGSIPDDGTVKFGHTFSYTHGTGSYTIEAIPGDPVGGRHYTITTGGVLTSD